MFADDLALLKELSAKYGPFPRPIVDVGGLEDPTIADYQVTIREMAAIEMPAQIVMPSEMEAWERTRAEKVQAAQQARYQKIHRPLSFLDEHYACENPETGGAHIEALSEKYPRTIGTAILLSVLEHVGDPFAAASHLYFAMKPGGICIVSVPWIFPYHPSPRDHWRFSPSGLRVVFRNDSQWEILECDWRLRIPPDAGVLDTATGRPTGIESCYIVCRARG